MDLNLGARRLRPMGSYEQKWNFAQFRDKVVLRILPWTVLVAGVLNANLFLTYCLLIYDKNKYNFSEHENSSNRTFTKGTKNLDNLYK